MAEPTKRDRVWQMAIAACCKHGKRQSPEDIAAKADVSERMAREVLIVMSDTGVIRRKVSTSGKVTYMCMDGVEIPENVDTVA